MIDTTQLIAENVGVSERQVTNTLKLLDDGATIPFISRYRKEQTGGLDEVKIETIKELAEKYGEMVKRKKTILATIEEQGALTPELEKRIIDSWVPHELEDIYMPYKPKRKTRAEVARMRGLEPLADLLMAQRERNLDAHLPQYINGEVKTVEEALQGARDIIAERINEDERARLQLRNRFSHNALIVSRVGRGKEKEGQNYRDYFDYSEPLKKCPGYRLLAIRRGETEGYLKVSIVPADELACIEGLSRLYVRTNDACGKQVQEAVVDAYKRLLRPAIEHEFATNSKLKADEEAIRIFTSNLRQLLLASPLGEKRVMGIDPGYRTGCKVVCLDSLGGLIGHCAVFPHPPKNARYEAVTTIQNLVRKHNIEAIAIGNGTAGRETEEMIRSLNLPGVEIYMVNEDGASVYSASRVARDEFPNFDVTVRGAISIGRRLIDPLAELVKIDPKSIGVGQYQHDVDPALLKQSLDLTVESCVNAVGVNVNTAGKHLLTYVSGLGPVLAQNIVDYRTKNGPFTSRKELLKVPRMGAKAYEQSAGFLRIPSGKNPLDNSAVHPESYSLVERMAKDIRCTVAQLIARPEQRQRIKLERYVSENVGMLTLNDIMAELEKPGRDPREPLKPFRFAQMYELEDLKPNMILPGIVTNVTNFGCFVDVGVHEDGLVHVSQMSDKFVSDPTSVVKLNQQVTVRVLDVDLERRRLSLKIEA